GEGDTSTVRSVFIVDPKNKVRLTLTYPKSIGRNFGEILRVIDALQLTDAAPVSTPVDWQPGDRIIVAPTMSTDDARQRFEDVEEVRPYLRWPKQPQTGAPRTFCFSGARRPRASAAGRAKLHVFTSQARVQLITRAADHLAVLGRRLDQAAGGAVQDPGRWAQRRLRDAHILNGIAGLAQHVIR